MMGSYKHNYSFEGRSAKQNLSHPVTTCQIEWEIDELTRIYKELKPMKVLEIGAQNGGSLYRWLVNAQPGATVIAIDQWKKSEMKIDPVPRWRAMVPEGIDFYPIIGDSHSWNTYNEVMDIIGPSFKIDFLFIDGDHTYEGAKRDWEMYSSLVKPGGIVAFHDLITPDFSPHIGVPELWREIQRQGYVTKELFARPKGKQPWGGIGVVYL